MPGFGRPARRLSPGHDAAAADAATGAHLVGREQALAALLGATAAPPALVVVEGETGVGKTALIQAALQRPALHDVTCLVGHCRPLQDPLPLSPVVEALSGLSGHGGLPDLNPVTGALRPLLPELADALPPAPDPLADRKAERQRLFRALLALLEAVAPAVLVLEDLHWTDAVTAEFVAYLAGAVPAHLSVVFSYRPEELGGGAAGRLARAPVDRATARISLPPLAPDQVGELAGVLLGAERVSEEFAAFLHERTAGLPFAIEELLQLLQDRQQVVRWEGQWLRRNLADLDVPAGVRDTVLARLHQLSAEARRVAEALAILADAESTEAVAATAGISDDDAVAGLDELYQARLLREVEAGRWQFRHALATQSVAEAIPAPRRTWLHRSASRHLERQDPAPSAALARHHREAGAVDAWARWAEAASDVADSVGNHAAVVELLHDLVVHPELDVAVRGRLAIIYGSAAVEAREHERAAGPLQQILDEPSLDASVRGRIRSQLGSVLVQCGRPGAAREQVARATTELGDRPDDQAPLMGCYLFLGFPWLGDDHLDRHLVWLDRAAEVGRRAGWEDRRLAGIHGDRVLIQLSTGDRDGWRAAQRLLDGAGAPDRERLRLAYNAAYAAVADGHFQRARDLVGAARRTAAEIDDSRFGPPTEGVALWLDWAMGDRADLATRAGDLEELGADSPTAKTAARLVQAALHAAAGDLEAGTRALDAVAAEARAAGEPGQCLYACAELARLAVSTGDHGRALAAAERGFDLVRAKGVWPWSGELLAWVVKAQIGIGRVGQATRIVDEACERLRDLDAPAAHAGLAQARGALADAAGDPQAAAAAYADARQRWDALPRPHLAALVAADHGRLLAATDRDLGVATLDAAARQLSDLGADWDAARVRRWLRELGVRRPAHRRGRKGYGSQLSPREQEVAELARAGLSNPEIGERLVLSRRTVERHMSNILRKLGIRSRRELAVAWRPKIG